MLKQKIQEDMKNAMRAKNSLAVQTLRGAMAAFTNELVAKGGKPTDEVDDALAIVVIKRLAKQRKDSAEQFTKGNRPELAEKEMQELQILESYLPATTSKADIEKVARAKMAELGVRDASGIGKLTGVIMKELKGTADGNDVKEVLQQLLA